MKNLLFINNVFKKRRNKINFFDKIGSGETTYIKFVKKIDKAINWS